GHPDTGGLFRFRLSVFLHSPFVRVCIFVVAALNWLGPCFSPAHAKMMASWSAAMSLFNLRNLMISRRLLLILLASVLMLLVLGVMMLQRSYRNLHDGKIEQLSWVVQAASGVLREAHERERSGELTREQAQQRVIELIGALRYAGEEYFFITDLDGLMFTHADPKLVGQNLNHLKDSNDVAFVAEMTRAAREQGQGTVAYLWPKS